MIQENKNSADINETNQKLDFKGSFSGNISENSLFSGQNKLVLTKSRLFFFVPDSLDEISAVNVKKALISERPTGSSVVGYSKVGYWYKKGTSTEWSRNMIISVKFNNFFLAAKSIEK